MRGNMAATTNSTDPTITRKLYQKAGKIIKRTFPARLKKSRKSFSWGFSTVLYQKGRSQPRAKFSFSPYFISHLGTNGRMRTTSIGSNLQTCLHFSLYTIQNAHVWHEGYPCTSRTPIKDALSIHLSCIICQGKMSICPKMDPKNKRLSNVWFVKICLVPTEGDLCT